MKKIILGLCLWMSCPLVHGQEIGVRSGAMIGDNVVALDVVSKISKYNRFHADVSFGNGVGFELLWDFLYRPVQGDSWWVYAGMGGAMIIVSDQYYDDDVYFGVNAEAGLAYYLKDIPVSLSADWRPVFPLFSYSELRAGYFGFNIRYIFGKRR